MITLGKRGDLLHVVKLLVRINRIWTMMVAVSTSAAALQNCSQKSHLTQTATVDTLVSLKTEPRRGDAAPMAIIEVV